MGFLDNRDLVNVPTIQEYYTGKTIFITGGSGFMGKVLIEKLLYSCSDLDRIYLLLRTKKGVNPQDRLDAIYSSRCFDRLRKEKPDIYKEKVFCIPGDASELGLGMSDEDRLLIINKTHIVFHVAASVRFDDSLKVAARLNLRGTREVVELAKEMRNLEVLVHVSTSYANTNRKRIDEVVYPAFADWRDTLEICDKLDDHTLNVVTPKYIGELPNTYVFTKQLAEHVMYEQKGKLPVVIMRPSIVISSHLEPMPGWIENLNGPVGMLIASGKGILRTTYTDPNILADYVPVDVAIKGFIASAWARGTKKLEPTDEIDLYNCSSSHIKTMSIGEIVEFGREVAIREIPLEDTLWYVGGSVTTSRLVYNFKVYFYHMLPALLVDLVLRIIGKKPMLFKLQRRIYVANLALHYFITQQWTFTNNNILQLFTKVREEDRDFQFEVDSIDTHKFFLTACAGAKQYILKEKMENLPKAKAHFRRMELLDRTVRITFELFVFWFIINTEFVKNLLQNITTFTY